LRVLHIVAGAAFGGAETFSQDAILALREEGVEQRVICRPHKIALARFAAAGIPVLPQQFSHFSRWRGAPAWITRQAEEFKADLVHAWMGRAASFVLEAMPCPVIGWFGGYYKLRSYENVDACIGVTRDIVDYLVRNGIPADRALLVHTFGMLADEPALDRSEFDTPADAALVLVLSRMHEKKGIDTMLRALALTPGVHLWLAGDGPEKRRYERLCARLGVADRVRFLGWRTDRTALYKAADLIVLPSRYEPFGTVIPEAWSMSKPLIATSAMGASQYMRDGVDGLLCPIDDPPALAACVTRLIADPALQARLSESGFEVYQSLFSKPAVMEALLETYRTVMRLGKRARNSVAS
jgi:glycosyltransferase involved in cell wall biosynthesis